MKYKELILAALLLILTGCFFINPGRISVIQYPCERNHIMEETDCIYLEFSLPVIKEEAESIFSVSGLEGVHSGDFLWENNRLIFIPAPSLKPGIRYVLSFNGTVHSESDKRIFTFDIETPFYFGLNDSPCSLIDFQPEESGTATIYTPLVFNFSGPVDQNSFKKGFSISPSSDYSISWNDSGDTATVKPEDRWDNLNIYTWRLNREIENISGIPIGIEYSSVLIVQEDSISPFILNVQSAEWNGTDFIPVSENLNNLLYKDVIYIMFSEPVDHDSVSCAFSLTPSLNGNVEKVQNSIYVFIPETGFIMQQEYELEISTEIEDLSGNFMKEDYIDRFSPDIPVLLPDKISANSLEFYPDDYNNTISLTVELTEPDNNIAFIIIFSLTIAETEKENIVNLILCRAFFPDTIPEPSLISVSWNVSNTQLILTYTGFEKSSAEQDNLYCFTIPGGQSGIKNGNGSFMPKKKWILLRTEYE